MIKIFASKAEEKTEVIFENYEVMEKGKTVKKTREISSKYICLPLDIIDSLYVRTKTIGITSFPFTFKGNVWKLYDVGGQRSERKKWKNIYDQTLFIYFVSLTDINFTCYEDGSTNRFEETLETFSNFYNQTLKESDIHLIFTKIDKFKETIDDMKLQSRFKDYRGNSWEEAYDFIVKKFESVASRKIKTIHSLNCLDQDSCLVTLTDILKNY